MTTKEELKQYIHRNSVFDHDVIDQTLLQKIDKLSDADAHSTLSFIKQFYQGLKDERNEQIIKSPPIVKIVNIIENGDSISIRVEGGMTIIK